MVPSKNLGVDLGTSGGDWLFRHGDLILGPVPGAQIVEKLFSGELDGKSEVQRLGSGVFVRIAEVDFFKVHLAKAEAKWRVDQHARSTEQQNRRKRVLRIGIVALVALLFAGAAASAATYLAIHKPWKDPNELLYEQYAELISVEPPQIRGAKAHKADEELIDYPGGPGVPRHGGEKGPTAPKHGKRPKMSDESEEPDGLQMAKFDQDAINAVVGSKQKTLYPCLVAEAQKKPGLSAKIPIEFVIGNDGRVTKVWVDHPSFKEGPLRDCFLRELQKWQFKSFEGERPTVGLQFKIGKG